MISCLSQCASIWLGQCALWKKWPKQSAVKWTQKSCDGEQSRVQCQTDTKFFGIKKNLQWHMRLFDIRNFMIQHWCSGFVRYSTAFSSCFDPWTKSLMEFSDGTRFFTLFYSGCRAKGVFLQPFYGSERFKPSIDAKEYCVTYFSFFCKSEALQ